MFDNASWDVSVLPILDVSGLKVSSRVRLSTLERLAVLEGTKTVVELPRAKDVMVLGNITAGRADKLTLVCGFLDLKNSKGRYVGDIPFIGLFVASQAAFIRKTFVPYLWPAPVDYRKAIEPVGEWGLSLTPGCPSQRMDYEQEPAPHCTGNDDGYQQNRPPLFPFPHEPHTSCSIGLKAIQHIGRSEADNGYGEPTQIPQRHQRLQKEGHGQRTKP